MTTYVFPGQGSQYKGMGENFFCGFKELTKKSDEILGYSVEELCLRDPHKQLHQTQYTQPALYVVNVLMYLKKIHLTGKTDRKSLDKNINLPSKVDPKNIKSSIKNGVLEIRAKKEKSKSIKKFKVNID